MLYCMIHTLMLSTITSYSFIMSNIEYIISIFTNEYETHQQYVMHPNQTYNSTHIYIDTTSTIYLECTITNDGDIIIN